MLGPLVFGREAGDMRQLREPLINLIVNAGDAVQGCDVRGTEIRSEKRGQSVLFSVTDSGSGMDAETKARCLEAHFTARVVGLGCRALPGA
jgi:two-component system C4-dicarboxylate transport sensor histidine kinase DctB